MNMNYQFWKNRKTFTPDLKNSQHGANNPECLMLFVASEGGRAACERAKDLATEWLKEYRNHLVIVSSNPGLTGFYQQNLSLYMIPDPKSKEITSPTQWNKSCENTMYRAIYTHLPSKFVFDGPYPYRGVLNAMEAAPNMKSIWIQSERTNKEVIAKSGPMFNETKLMDYVDKTQAKQHASKRNYRAITKKILLATGYGYHEGSQPSPSLILKHLSAFDDLEIIGIKTYTESSISSRISEQWGEVIDNPGIESLQAAIVSDNLELITKLHTMMVPTLCLLDQNTSPEAKKLINSLASSGAIFVAMWNDKTEIQLCIKALLGHEWNLAITQRGTVDRRTTPLHKFINS
tara:strand:+ start:3318 stop:4358 length:1041 start_codon:yes stop_codon:yes gene_type:complete